MKMINKLFLGGMMLLLCQYAAAFSMERYVDGVHYKKLAGTVAAPGTVMEFFSFGCPHCNGLEPHVEEWLKAKPDSVKFVRVPATWNKKYHALAQLYYVMEALGQTDALVKATFDHIHKQGNHIHSKKEAIAYLVSQGMDEAKVTAAWDSEEVGQKMRQASNLYAQYQVRGVPAFLVGGQYQTSVNMAGSEEELFQVVDFLLSK